MILVDRLSKHYGSLMAIQTLSFCAEPGEILGLLGPKGAGKTTTLRILAGLLPATSGRAMVAGYEVSVQPLAVRQCIGYLPENVALYGDMTVQGYLSFVAAVKGVPHRQRRQAIGEVLEACGLRQEERRRIGSLSRDCWQRIGLAQALLHKPPVLLLDEPTAGLEPEQLPAIRQLLTSLRHACTVLLSTRAWPEVQATCDRVVILRRGQVVAIDTPAYLSEQVGQYRRLHLEVHGPEAAVHALLCGLEGVLHVAKDGTSPTGAVCYTITTSKTGDLRATIAQAVVQQGWQLLALRPLRLSLDEVFTELAVGEETEDV